MSKLAMNVVNGAVVRFWNLLRHRPDALYDFQSAWFSIMLGFGLVVLASPTPTSPHAHIWGALILAVGVNKHLAVLSENTVWHSVSCLVSLMAWLFISVAFFSHGRPAQGLPFTTFVLASWLRYLQIAYHSATHSARTCAGCCRRGIC